MKKSRGKISRLNQGEKVVKSAGFRPKLVVVILGSTSSGKTALAVKLARQFAGEIISADSRQVYRGMDIGSGKDLAEYGQGKNKVPYHLIDIVSPKTKFNLARYQKLAFKSLDKIIENDKLPLLVGGTGLYLQAVVNNYKLSSAKPNLQRRRELESLSSQELLEKLLELKPSFAKKLNNSDRHNHRRLVRYLEIIESGGLFKKQSTTLPYDFLVLGLEAPDEVLRKRISQRLETRLSKEGLIEEVKRLQQQGISFKRLISFGLEYRFVSYYLQGSMTYPEMVEKLTTAIYRFAKRQKTWFKRWQKQGQKIYWVNNYSEARQLIKDFQKTDV